MTRPVPDSTATARPSRAHVRDAPEALKFPGRGRWRRILRRARSQTTTSSLKSLVFVLTVKTATSRPSGEKAIPPLLPPICSGLPIRRIVRVSQNTSVPLSPLTARVWPSGLTATPSSPSPPKRTWLRACGLRCSSGEKVALGLQRWVGAHGGRRQQQRAVQIRLIERPGTQPPRLGAALRRLGAALRRAGLTALLHGEGAGHGGEKQQRHDAGEDHAQSAAPPGPPGRALVSPGRRARAAPAARDRPPRGSPQGTPLRRR